MPVNIDSRFRSHLVMVPLLLAWTVVGWFAVAALVQDAAAAPAALEWIKIGLAAGFLVGVVGYLISYYVRRLALTAEFGPDLCYRNLLGEHRAEWPQVGRLVLKELALPIPAPCVLKIVLTDGTRIDLWAGRGPAAAVYDLARRSPLPGDWAGLPLPRATAWTTVALGGLVLLAGLWIDALLAGDLLGPAPKERVVPEEVPLLLGMAVGIPLAGLAGLAFGAYHLIWQPIAIRPGVERFREGAARTTEEAARDLFTRHE